MTDSIKQFIAECRDALAVALPYVSGENFSDLYARKQVFDQYERCVLALEDKEEITTSDKLLLEVFNSRHWPEEGQAWGFLIEEGLFSRIEDHMGLEAFGDGK